MIVYKITNKINRKIYVGCTTKEIQHRFLRHFSQRKNKTAIARAFTKYGKEGFLIEELEECKSKKEMFEREKFWIKKLQSNKIGYNLTDGGDCGPVKYGKDNWNYGKKHPHITKMNKELKGKTYEEIYGKERAKEIKEKISKSNVLKKHSENSIVMMSKKRKLAWDNGLYKNVGPAISKAKTGIRSNRRIKIQCLNNKIIYDGYADAAQKLKLSASNITNVINGKYTHTKGFSFVKVL